MATSRLGSYVQRWVGWVNAGSSNTGVPGKWMRSMDCLPSQGKERRIKPYQIHCHEIQ